jgi:hypothetical protein
VAAFLLAVNAATVGETLNDWILCLLSPVGTCCQAGVQAQRGRARMRRAVPAGSLRTRGNRTRGAGCHRAECRRLAQPEHQHILASLAYFSIRTSSPSAQARLTV